MAITGWKADIRLLVGNRRKQTSSPQRGRLLPSAVAFDLAVKPDHVCRLTWVLPVNSSAQLSLGPATNELYAEYGLGGILRAGGVHQHRFRFYHGTSQIDHAVFCHWPRLSGRDRWAPVNTRLIRRAIEHSRFPPVRRPARVYSTSGHGKRRTCIRLGTSPEWTTNGTLASMSLVTNCSHTQRGWDKSSAAISSASTINRKKPHCSLCHQVRLTRAASRRANGRRTITFLF